MSTNPNPNPNLPGSQPDMSDPANAHLKQQQGVEPSEIDAPDTSEDDAAPAAPAEPTETPDARLKRLAFKDDKRTAIAAKRNNMSLEERQTFAKEDPEEYRISQQVAGVAPEDDELLQQEQEPAAPGAPAAPAQPAAPGQPATPPIASSGKTYNVRVYGKDLAEVSEEEVVTAGIRALQTRAATDIRMNQVATREAQLVKWEGDLQSLANNLAKGLDMHGQPIIPAGGPGTPQPPASGVAGAINRDRLREAQAALLRGDDETSSVIMAEILESALKAGRPEAAPESPRKVEVPARPAGVGDPWGDEQRTLANRVFNDENLDLSDAQFRLAQREMSALLADQANHGKSLVDLAREAGKTVRAALNVAPIGATPAAPAPGPAPAGPALQQRRELKARIPMTPSPTSARAPNAQPAAPRFPTNAEHVRQLQMRSGSNSSPRPPR